MHKSSYLGLFYREEKETLAAQLHRLQYFYLMGI